MNNFDWDKYEQEVRKWAEKINPKSKNYLFFRDGIVNEKNWNSEGNLKVLFILKELNDQESPYEKSYPKGRSWLDMTCCGDMEDIFKGKMWRKITTLAAGIEKAIIKNKTVSAEEYICFEEPKTKYDEHIKHINKIAILNLKKLGGGGTENSPKSIDTVSYEEHGVKFKEQIKEQINIISPQIIICCAPSVFDCFKKEIYNDEDMEIYDSGIIVKGVVVVRGYHPAYEQYGTERFKNLFYANTINNCLELWRRKNNK